MKGKSTIVYYTLASVLLLQMAAMVLGKWMLSGKTVSIEVYVESGIADLVCGVCLLLAGIADAVLCYLVMTKEEIET